MIASSISLLAGNYGIQTKQNQVNFFTSTGRTYNGNVTFISTSGSNSGGKGIDIYTEIVLGAIVGVLGSFSAVAVLTGQLHGD